MTKKYLLLSDVVNTGGTLSKNHGPIIQKGETVEMDPEHASTKWLTDSKVIELGETDQAPSNSILDQNAQNAISIIESGVHSQEQLEELLTFESENKKRSTVTAAINEALEAVKKEQE